MGIPWNSPAELKSSNNWDFQDTAQIPIQLGILNAVFLLDQIHNEEIDAAIAKLTTKDQKVKVWEGKIAEMAMEVNVELQRILEPRQKLGYAKGWIQGTAVGVILILVGLHLPDQTFFYDNQIFPRIRRTLFTSI